MRKEFSGTFKKANTVILCPVYSAGEKIKLGFSYIKFAKEIIHNSKVKLLMVNDVNQLAKFLKKYDWKENSNWNGSWKYLKLDETITLLNRMNIKELKNLLYEFGSNVRFEYDLKKIGLI